MADAVATQNPFAAPEEILNEVPSYRLPATAAFYSTPGDAEENGVMDSPIGAYAPGLREFPGGTPDPMRVRHMPARDFRPDPNEAPEHWYDQRDAEDRSRHSVEFQDADGWQTWHEGISGRPAAIDPRRNPKPETRVTSRMSPRTYLFTRPLWGGPHRQSGEHFSMADHRRDYPILGTQPVRKSRNTYRIMPAPLDTDMVDVPASQGVTDVPEGRVQSVEVPSVNPWRL